MIHQKSEESPSQAEIQEIENLLGDVGRQFQSTSGVGFLTTETRIGKYCVKSLLGYGGQAVCFLAYDDELLRPVVLKLYRGGLTDNQRERIISEGRALASIKSPHVAKCYAVENLDDRPYLILEYIDGQPLHHWSANRTFSKTDIRKIVADIVRSLEAVHAKRLLHLDLKPSNVIVDDEGRVTLIDFGLSHEATDDETTLLTGTPSFMAPERIAGEPVDERTDVYGVGAIIYFLLTKKAPFDGDSKLDVLKQLMCTVPDWSSVESEKDRAQLISVGKKCMAHKPGNRFKNVGEIAESLDSKKSLPLSIQPFRVVAFVALLMLVSLIYFVAFHVGGQNLRVAASTSNPEGSAPATQNENAPTLRWLRNVANTAKLRNDFPIDFIWKGVDSQDETKWSSDDLRKAPLLSLKKSQQYTLEAIPKNDSYIAVFSFEFSAGSEKIDHVNFVGPPTMRLTRKGETFHQKINATSLTPDGKLELLWVFAATEPFDGQLIAEDLEFDLMNQLDDTVQDTNLEWAASGLARGIEGAHVNTLVSGILCPYRVE